MSMCDIACLRCSVTVLSAVLAAFLVSDVCWADRIIFESGQVKEGRIHEENFVFPEERDNPNFMEMEVLDHDTNTITVFAFDMRNISPIREVIREPFEFPEGAVPSDRLKKARERYKREQEERLAKATPTPSAAVPLAIEVDLARGWFLRGTGANSVRLVSGLKVSQGDSLRTRYNSRGRVKIGETVILGVDPNTSLRLETAVWDQINRHYSLRIPLDSGQIWVENKRGASEVRTMVLSIPPFTIQAGESLFSVNRGKSDGWRIALYRGTGFNLKRGTEAIELAAGQEVSLAPDGSISKSPVDVSAARDGLQAWDDWHPIEISVETDLDLPDYVLPKMDELQFALPSMARTETGQVGMPPRGLTLARTLDAYRTALTNYKDDVGSYPGEDTGLDVLREDPGVPGWKGPYVPVSLATRDPWGRPFAYHILEVNESGALADVYSLGPNGVDERRLGDDIY